MNLKTAITKSIPHWNTILEQIGIPFSQIEWNKKSPDEYAVVIVNSVINEEEKKSLLSYVENGGSLLVEANFFKSVIKTKNVYIKYIFSEEKIFNHHLPLIDLYKTCCVAVNANSFYNQDGISAVSSYQLGSGNIMVIPGNFVSAIFDQRVSRKNFYSSIRKYPSERVSEVSKGGIYHFIKSSIEFLYHKRNLPFVSLWNFPGNSKNIFLFRIDTDFGTSEQVDSLYNTLRDNHIKGSWFIETKSAESWIKKISFFEDQEIGLHCYRHRVFNSYKKNYVNLKKGIQDLNDASIFPKGIAAPFGEWNNPYNEAAENLGLEYSSEFSNAYDCFPYSTKKTELSKIIQIPIHPISFGRLSHSGFNDDEMYNYFVDVIRNKIALTEPIILYTHPLEKRYEILKRIFNFVNDMNLPNLTFSEYSTWWKERTRIKYSASMNKNELKTAANSTDNSFWFRISNPSGEKLFNAYYG